MRHPASVILFTFVALLAGRAPAETFHVAPGGDDSWSGRLAEPSPSRDDGPFATIGGARDALRKLRSSRALREPVQVAVHAGTYRIGEPIVFGPEDSGTPEAPITFAGEPGPGGEKPIVSGGRPIGGWKREGDLLVATVPEARGGRGFGALWVNGRRARPARMPDTGWLRTAGKAGPAPGEPGKPRDSIAFRFKPGDIRRWSALADARVVVLHSWETSILRIASVEEETSTVVFTGPARWPFENWGPNQRYSIENIPEALDAPGEWRLDSAAGTVSYRPLEGEDAGTIEVIAPVAERLLVLAGKPAEGRFVEHLSFRGIRFLHTEWSPGPAGHSDSQAAVSTPAAVEATGARQCVFADCEIAGTGGYGIWLRSGSRKCVITRCEVRDLGAGGVRIGETASPATEAEAAGENTVESSFIHDGGRILSGGVGVWIGRSSGNSIVHNEICDLDYTAVSVGWSWGYDPSSAHQNRIERNHIHHIGRGVLNDMGGIYTLGVSPGTIERGNVIHDVYSHSFGGWGIYTDEGSSEILIEKNIVYRTSSGCFHQHYGKGNVVRNNIFAFGDEGVLRRSREEEHDSFVFERNIVLADGSPFHIVSWANGHYRLSSNLYWDYADAKPLFAGMTFAEWQAKGRDAGSVIADPLCEDPRNGVFRVKPGSPAAAVGFEPFEPDAGLRGPPEWVAKPGRIARDPGPPPAPEETGPFEDDFEATAEGGRAGSARTAGESGKASIRVVTGAAASGTRSLRFQDAPGLPHAFEPYLHYTPVYRQKGRTVAVEFALRLEAGAVFYHEWRDAREPYRVGPSFRVDGGGTLHAKGTDPVKLPRGDWVSVKVASALGSGSWQIEVSGPAGGILDARLPCDPAFRELRWLGFVSDADAEAVFHIDRVRFGYR